MSSVSSFDVFIDDDNHYDVADYIKKLDDLESGDSGSDDIRPVSLKNTPIIFKSTADENELDIIRMYLKCKKNVFHFASQHNQKYAVVMCGVSLLLSGSLVFIPFLSIHVDKFVSGAISLALFVSLCFSKYSGFDNHQQQYKIISNKYGALHSNVESFLAKFVYMTDKHSAFYEKIKEIETKLHWMKEDNRDLLHLPYFIRIQVPFVANVDIFQSIHGIELEQNSLVSRYHNVNNELDDMRGSSSNMNRDEGRIKVLKENKKKIKKALKGTNYSGIKLNLEKEYQETLIHYDC
jgi:hypothetical protein